MHNALAGIRVVEMSHVIAGPMTAHLLGAFGAEVIKIEEPVDGDALRRSRRAVDATTVPPAFAVLNQRKRSLAIDIRAPASRRYVLQLLAQTDVVIENYRPGALARYGLDYAAVRELNPRIVYCSISGYGQTGPWSARPAYDHVVQAAVGMMMINGAEGGPPIKTGFPLVDTATAMMGALSVCAALLRRRHEGAGCHLDLSMVQGAMQLLLPTASAAFSGGRNPERMGNAGWTGSPGADTFQCADGWIAIAANTFAQIERLARALKLDGLAAEVHQAGGATPDRFARAADVPGLHDRLAGAIAGQTGAALEVHLNAAGVPAARVRTLIDFLRESAELSFAGLGVHRVHGPQGTAWVPAAKIDASPRHEAPAETHYPGHGEHTREILRALGAGDAELEQLERAGLIRDSSP
ncbi:MAG TPA: CoA transferase, partial [Burkholderiaceae bacterium]|nr:CoA transferase [Burkholderiaceae bacterium]